MSEIERKLASVRRINNIQPIDGADSIEVATVDGWKVVVKKGDFSIDDLAIYFEIDSWVPHAIAPFLTKGENAPHEYNGVKGERLRTIRLRGQISQGLLLAANKIDLQTMKYQLFHNDTNSKGPATFYLNSANEEIPYIFEEGYDLTEFLSVQKWEAPISAQMSGIAKGNFPTHLIPKTDQERIQNCFKDLKDRNPLEFFEVTLKLDGSSMTIFRYEDILRVCSRNMELKISDENSENVFVKMALSLQDKIPNGFAFQGEIMGPGIQGNREKFKEHKFFVFDIFNIDEQCYLSSYSRISECRHIKLDHIPFIGITFSPNSVEEALSIAERNSINHSVAEGVVWKSIEDPTFSFKAINNNFLLKEI